MKVEKKNVKALKQKFIQLNTFNLEDDFCYVFWKSWPRYDVIFIFYRILYDAYVLKVYSKLIVMILILITIYRHATLTNFVTHVDQIHTCKNVLLIIDINYNIKIIRYQLGKKTWLCFSIIRYRYYTDKTFLDIII